MIKDNIEYANNYYGISNGIREGFEWLKTQDLTKIKDGKYILNNENYANVQTYDTKDDALFEAHKQYIDIQYMIDGVENIEITDIKNCKTEIEYAKDKDIEFFSCNNENCKYKLSSGEFIILFPNDAHKPSINYEKQHKVKKIVVKIKI